MLGFEGFGKEKAQKVKEEVLWSWKGGKRKRKRWLWWR